MGDFVSKERLRLLSALDTTPLHQVIQQLNLLILGYASIIHPIPWDSEPPYKRKGTRVYADGTHWDPGSGEGWYEWNGTSWERC